MKIKYLMITMLFFCGSVSSIFSQENEDNFIIKAMSDELDRNITELMLEDLKKPFFISYKLSDISLHKIKATLGSIVLSEAQKQRKPFVDVMVGNYQLNNKNYTDINNMFGGSSYYGRGGNVSIEDDYYGIRRAFWIRSDYKYKSAAETYERKVSAIEQQNIDEKLATLPDFDKVEKTTIISPLKIQTFDVAKWEKIAKELSNELSEYKELTNSNAMVYLYSSNVYFVNSEGSKYVQPLNLFCIRVNATTQANDGEPLFDNRYYYGKSFDDFPPIENMKADVKQMGKMLTQLRNAPVFDDSYAGPVLFEGQAVGELLTQKFFSDYSGFITSRDVIYGDERSARFDNKTTKRLEGKIGRKVISNDITVKAIPTKEVYANTNLIGSYKVDAECVIPKDELVIVENGILKTLLNNRTPTPKINHSNGHLRHYISSYGSGTKVGPGVVSFESNSGTSASKLKKALLKYAKNEGLDYAIIIRRMQSPTSGIEKSTISTREKGTVTHPIYVYKVKVSDGSEELVRSSKIEGVSISAMKRIVATSNKEMVYNTLTTKKSGGGFYFYSQGSDMVNGTPTSIIAPDAILLEELEIEKIKRAVTIKPPVVSSPLSSN